MNWTYDALWAKARSFSDRANEYSHDDTAFPLWATLAFELLARSTLAKIHPSLLAEPGDEHILYACGCSETDTPKSISVSTVLRRCSAIVPNLTERHLAVPKALIERRNEELHSGGTPFADFPTSVWLTDYYIVCKLLLENQEKSLADFLDASQADVAQAMINARAEDTSKLVKKTIAAHKTVFESWDQSTKEAKTADAERKPSPHRPGESVPCPACGSRCYIGGKVVKVSPPRLDEDRDIEEVITLLPTELTCQVCGLQLNGHGALDVAGHGGLVSIKRWQSPLDYFESDVQAYLQSLADEAMYE